MSLTILHAKLLYVAQDGLQLRNLVESYHVILDDGYRLDFPRSEQGPTATALLELLRASYVWLEGYDDDADNFVEIATDDALVLVSDAETWRPPFRLSLNVWITPKGLDALGAALASLRPATP